MFLGCHVWDSKCTRACLPHCMPDEGWNPAQHSSKASTRPLETAQTRDVSAWPLGVAQASNINTVPGCDRTTDAGMSSRGTMSPDVATASDGSTGHSDHFGPQQYHRPQTSTWPQMATKTIDIQDIQMAFGDSTLAQTSAVVEPQIQIWPLAEAWARYHHGLGRLCRFILSAYSATLWRLQFRLLPQCRNHLASLCLSPRHCTSVFPISPSHVRLS